MTRSPKHIDYDGTTLTVLDQTRLPGREESVACTDVEAVARAIETMQVRGAPLIGVVAAFGMAIAAREARGDSAAFSATMEQARGRLAATRPTAVNLFWALERMGRTVAEVAAQEPAVRAAAMAAEARAIWDEDVAMCRAMGRFGAGLIQDGETIMTHCNAGALATGGYGTALGVIRGAVEAGKRVRVVARETRPLLQGARLTAYELARDGIEVTVIPDSAGAHVMRTLGIDRVVVGADRIAANGDTANKIGTYDLAIIAREHGIPFHVAAPYSTVDLSLANGEGIPIEERGEEEMRELGGSLLVPPGARVFNPAFDVTPARYITSIITEAGVASAPLGESLARLVGGKG